MRPGEISGLNEATRILNGVEGVALIRFTGADVVRAILYVVGQRYETGQALPVTGGQEMVR